MCVCVCVCVCVFREGGEDGDSQGDGSSQPDTISIASRTSQNTVDSDKVGNTHSGRREKAVKAADWDSICLLWRADDPQLCQSYRVSYAATSGRSRGCMCVPMAEGLCVFMLIIKVLCRLRSCVCLEGVWSRCVCVCVCVCVWEVSSNVNMWAEKLSTMKNLFRLCAGVCANDTYQPASHIQVSPSLSFYFESQPTFLCTNNTELLFPFILLKWRPIFCIRSKCKCMHICTLTLHWVD